MRCVQRKINRLLAFILLFGMIMCGGLPVQASEAGNGKRVVRVPCGINDFLRFDENGAPVGYCKNYLDGLAQINKWEYEYVEATWTEAVDMLDKGEIDILFPTTYMPERERTMDFSKISGGYTALGLFARADSGYGYENFSSFNGARIAVTEGTTNVSELAAYAEEHDFTYEQVFINDYDEKVRALEQGEVDMVIFTAANEVPDAVLVALLDASPFYYTVKKGNKEILDELDRGMQQMLKDCTEVVAETLASSLVGKNSNPLALLEEEREFIESGAEIVVGFYEETEPLAYVDKDGGYGGLYIELLEYVSDVYGLNMTFYPIDRDYNWQDILEHGDIDFYIGASSDIVSKNADYRTADVFVEYENVLVKKNTSAFHLPESPVIALTNERAYWEANMPEGLEHARIKLYRSAKECLIAVQHGEADATLINNIEFNYQSKNARFSNLTLLEKYRYPSNASLVAVENVDPVMFSTLEKAVKYVPQEYASSVTNDYLNMTYRSETFLDRLYASRQVLFIIGVLLVVAAVMFVVIRMARKRQNALLLQVEKREQHQLKILAALSSNYSSVYYTNLNENHCEAVQLMEGAEEQAGGRLRILSTYSESIQQYVDNYVTAEYREKLLNLCDPQVMARQFEEKKDFAIRYQVKPNDSHLNFFEMNFVHAGVDEQDRAMVFGIRCVDEVAKEESLHKQILKDSLDAANRASTAKSEFLSKMSHDIRTPMNGIIGMTALASTYADDPVRVRETLDKIATSSRHLLGLINEVLDMSKIESGTIKLTEEEFNLSELISNLLVMLQPDIDQHRHNLSVHMENLKHEDVIGDHLRIQQVFMNLLSNAIKYTPDGGRISLTVRENPIRVSDQSSYVFIFEDNGVGMTEEFLEHLFEPFSRADDLRTSKIQGTGLGMAITQSIVRLMNGNIKVESTVGKGTTFTVLFYLKLQKEKEKKAENSSDSSNMLSAIASSDYKGRRVLVVEDNIINREIVCEILKMAGIQVEEATDGKEALDMFAASESGYYDLVLMDVQMPVMNGYESTRAIRALNHPDAEKIPIIAMTANAFAEDVQNAKAAGMNEHLSKPIEFKRLSEVLQKCFESQSQG